MKKCWLLILVMLMLTGCGAAETFETVADDMLQPVMGQVREIVLTLPDSAAAQVMQNDEGGKLYLCDGYVLTVQTLESGDLDRTARTLSGFSADSLTMVETAGDDVRRHDWVWTAAGEGGDQIGRAAVLDDGDYHYCVTVMAGAEAAGSLEAEWNGIFTSFALG